METEEQPGLAVCHGNIFITRQLQDLNQGLLKSSIIPTYHTDSQTCVAAQ